MKVRLNTYSTENNFLKRSLSRLYSGLGIRTVAFIVLFGLFLLALGVFMISEYSSMIRFYQTKGLQYLVFELYRQYAFFLLMTFGALLFLVRKRIGWIILTGVLLSLLVNGIFLFSDRVLWDTFDPGVGGIHDNINPDIGAMEVVFLIAITILTVLMYLKTIRNAFNIKRVWSAPALAVAIILIQKIIPLLFQMRGGFV